MTDDNRDWSMNRPFAGEARPSPEPREIDVCPDAETIAAWSDHGLAPAERARLETHFADCARCQMHLATMAKMLPEEPEIVPSAERARIWKWLVPAMGAVAAAGLWFIVQTPTAPTPPERPQEVQVRAPELRSAAPQPQSAAPRPQSAAIPKRAEPPAAIGSVATRRMEDALQKQEARANQAPAKDAARADKQAERFAREASPPAVAESIVVDSRAADAYALTVRRADDGRVTWDVREGDISAQLTAGASPAPSVIWLAGKGGLVLRSTDGRSWRRLPFPEPVDLTSIEASSDVIATVTTADARAFTTADGGLTWRRK